LKLSLKVSLIIGSLVLFFMMGMVLVSNSIASGIMLTTAEKSLQSQSAIAAQLIADGIIKAELNVLYELANRPQTQTMDWETQRDSLLPDIDRHEYLDFAIVNHEGIAHYIKDNSTSNLADRDYIIKALGGQSVISDVLISRVIGKPVVMFAVPIRVDGVTAGALIGRRDGAVLTDMTRQIGMGKTGYVYMINSRGTIICHPDTDLVYNQFTPTEAAKSDPALQSMADFVTAVLSNKTAFEEYVVNGKTVISAYASVPNTDWILIGAVERAEFFSEINRMLISTLILGLVSTLVAVIIYIAVFSFSLIRPIKDIVSAAISLANMQFDIDIPRKRKDEIGDMQRAFYTIRDELKKTITDINNEHLGQKNISGNLHISIKDSSDGLDVITRNMDSVQGKTDTQMESVIRTSESVEEIIRHIHSLDEAVDIQAGAISRSSDSIEQMVQDVDSVRRVVQGAHETTGRLGLSSEAGRKSLSNLTEELKQIAQQSAFLEEANRALVKIAAQTNLLAMNAAIEAAHAGELGKGFAVVAGEVRSLAELSNKESSAISEEIKNMRNGIEKIRRVSDETVNTLGSMFTEVTDMQNSFDTVTSAVEAQASHGAQVLEALSRIRETTDQVRTGSDEIQRESESIHKTVEDLKSISKDVNDSILDVQKASKDIASSLNVARMIAEGHYLIPPDDIEALRNEQVSERQVSERRGVKAQAL
jgi:methyl-accepting chemotaxis protein